MTQLASAQSSHFDDAIYLAKAVATPRKLPRPSVLRFVLDGEVTQTRMDELLGVLEHLARGGMPKAAIDFSRVTHLDYRGVSKLATRAAAARRLGGDIRLCGLSPYLATIIQAAGAFDAFDEFHTIEDAVESFTKRAA